MTVIYFVRHVQPDRGYFADNVRPLTVEGLADTRLVCEYFADKKPDYIISSPYKRSYDTVKSTAEYHGMSIATDIRLREREKGESGQNNPELFRKRWENTASRTTAKL